MTNIDRLSAVPLEFSAVLRREPSTLRTVMELRRGAVLPLELHADAAVELRCDGKTLALGEVVMLKNRLGVRVVGVVPASKPVECSAGTPAPPAGEAPDDRGFPYTASELATTVGLTRPRAAALRQYLGIDENPECRVESYLPPRKCRRYSEAALRLMRDALPAVDMDQVWELHRQQGTREH